MGSFAPRKKRSSRPRSTGSGGSKIKKSISLAGPAKKRGMEPHKAVSPGALTSSLGRGKSIEPGKRVPYENFFGRRLNNVGIHCDPKADGWARALGAQAFTVGDQIGFARGEYAPETQRGRYILAHELAHVVQQSGANTVSSGKDYEQAANHKADQFVQGHSLSRHPSSAVQAYPRAIQLFSGSAAAGYARTWATSTNPKYRRMGNDCTNFVSQAMLAGGWKMKSGWYRSDSVWWYNSLNASWTWGGAHNFSKFVKSSGRGTLAKNVNDLREGDVLQMSFSGGHINHSMVVTKKTSQNFYLSYHTSDTLNKNFYGPGGIYESYKSNSNVKYYGWNIS